MSETLCTNKHGIDLNPPELERHWTELLREWVAFNQWAGRWGWWEVDDDD